MMTAAAAAEAAEAAFIPAGAENAKTTKTTGMMKRPGNRSKKSAAQYAEVFGELVRYAVARTPGIMSPQKLLASFESESEMRHKLASPRATDGAVTVTPNLWREIEGSSDEYREWVDDIRARRGGKEAVAALRAPQQQRRLPEKKEGFVRIRGNLGRDRKTGRFVSMKGRN